jgi:hypothetical protein
MPSGYDAEVAELFRDLRAATALTEMDLAARIGTRPEVVQALEQGALQALPPWAETCRVVNAYGTMLNLDVRPLLRRIYAQLEAGIVELQPKPFPEVPTMTPPDSDEFGFGSGAPAGGSAPNPLDIPWPPPQPQGQPQRQAWQNAGPPGVPPPRRPNAGAFPQPQNMRPRPQGGPQPSQAFRGGVQPMPQAPRPAPGQRPAPPQSQQPQRPPQPRGPQPQGGQPQAAAPRSPQPSEAELLEAAFGPAAAQKAPEPPKKRGRSRLLKLGIVVLVLGAIAAGLALLYVYAPGTVGNAPATGTTDPDDPRSKKTDRLPEALPPPAQ